MQRLSRAHPHTLLGSLTAVAKYPSRERALVAERLLNVMRLYDQTLVQEAISVNSELIRVSMTWEEKCCHSIESAAKFLFGEGKRSELPFHKEMCILIDLAHFQDPPGLVQALDEMCRSFEVPETVGEHEFLAKYGESLRAARGECPVHL